MDYVSQIKDQTTQLVLFALENLTQNLIEVSQTHPTQEVDQLVSQVMPTKDDLDKTIETYFRENKYISITPHTKKVVDKSPSIAKEVNKKKRKRRNKYLEIQLPEEQLCRFTSSEKAFDSPIYIHLSNNMIFVDKNTHYLCIGCFEPSSNQVEWFPE